jgi:hypothetical protein
MSGQGFAAQATSADITDTSAAGGPTVEASLDSLQAEVDGLTADYAPLASPVFTGNPRGPTPAANDNDTSLATTAYVQTELADYAPLASPTLTGVPAAPTAAALTNTTQIATTAFVTTADNLKANLAGPTFTGVPAAPTAAPGTDTTQLATTAFVAALGALKQPAGVPVEVASDAAAAITATTNALYLAETTAGTKVITFSGAYPGQTVPIRLVAASGGEYTLPVQGGTLTLDAADEEPLIVRNAANDAWLVLRKGGATIVP